MVRHWDEAFILTPTVSQPAGSPLSLSLSPPLITTICWKLFMGNVQKLSVCLFLYVCMHEYDYLFGERPTPNVCLRRRKSSQKCTAPTSKGSDVLGHVSQFKSVWLPVSKLCSLHLWVCVMEPRTLDGGMGGTMGVVRVLGDLMKHKAQCSLWHFKAPSVSPQFKPLGMTHVWQCYITHHALKAPTAR